MLSLFFVFLFFVSISHAYKGDSEILVGVGKKSCESIFFPARIMPIAFGDNPENGLYVYHYDIFDRVDVYLFIDEKNREVQTIYFPNDFLKNPEDAEIEKNLRNFLKRNKKAFLETCSDNLGTMSQEKFSEIKNFLQMDLPDFFYFHDSASTKRVVDIFYKSDENKVSCTSVGYSESFERKFGQDPLLFPIVKLYKGIEPYFDDVGKKCSWKKLGELE